MFYKFVLLKFFSNLNEKGKLKMKKTVYSKIIVFLAVLGILISAVPGLAFATALGEMSITVRIEGVSSNLYYGEMKIPYGSDLNVKKALEYVDSQIESLNITFDGAYITDINGDVAATFGGWDGWMYRVNNIEPSVGIEGYVLAENDSLLIYYGDPFGEGMQFPIVDSSKISQGILKFTSKDTTYDEEFNATETINPVKGAVVTWFDGETSTSYKTDDNGEVTIPQDKLTLGVHKIQIEKYSTTTDEEDNFLPVVLRLSPDTTVNVDEVVSSSDTSSESTVSDDIKTVTDNDNAPTGDSANGLFVMMFLASLSILAIAKVVIKREKAQ